MGGRGASSSLSGRKMSLKRLLDNIKGQPTLDDVRGLNLKIEKSQFSSNGNSIQLQIANVQNIPDGEELSLRFYSSYDPRQITPTRDYIRSNIELTHKNSKGNIDSVRTLSEMKTKSVRSARKQYEIVLEQWKKITRQKNITF